jgi:ComF family protein
MVISDFLHWLPAYFFPKICYGCGKEGSFTCPDCRPKVAKAINSLICPNCQKQSPLGMAHSECRKTNGLDGLVSYYRYAGWAKEIVKDAKFGLNPHWRAMKELAEEFAKELVNRKSLIVNRKSPTVVSPVPLHWWRKMKRGFNQAEIIAKPTAKLLNLPLMTNLIERSVYSLPQTLVGDKSRRANVKKAFSINKKTKTLPDSIILIDDVWTSGSTMKECCRTLKSAGVKKVWGITLLRA